MHRRPLLLAALMLFSQPARAEECPSPPEVDLGQSLDGLTVGALRVLRNTVYARHGYEFRSKDLSAYFGQQGWYRCLQSELWAEQREFRLSDLDADERSFVARVRAREEAIRKKARDPGAGRLYVYDALWNAHQFPDFPPGIKARIEREGFVVLPGRWSRFPALYEANRTRVIPSFVTSDMALHLAHLYCDGAQRRAETERLLPVATELSGALRTRAVGAWQGESDPERRAAAAMLARYFAVAQALFQGTREPALPPELRAEAHAELARVHGGEGDGPSSVTGAALDYSVFAPYGHYTSSAQLGRFFQGMAWYRNATFDLADAGHARALALLAHLMGQRGEPAEKRLLAVWDDLVDRMAFFVGDAGDLGPEQFLPSLMSVYGTEGGAPAVPAGEFKVEDVGAHLRRFVQGEEKVPFRFVPRAYPAPHGVATPTTASPRGGGLAFLAARGNPEAAALVGAQAEGSGPPSNLPGRAPPTPRGRRPAVGELHALWEQALDHLARPAPKAAPALFHRPPWRRKQLQAALASWVWSGSAPAKDADATRLKRELSEDWLDPSPGQRGYVEPVPELYEHLGHLVRRVTRTVGIDPEPFLPRLMVKLEGMSRKELAGKPLEEMDYELVDLIGAWTLAGASLSFLDFDFLEYPLDGPSQRVELLSRVQQADGRFHYSALGHVDELYVVVEVAGRPTLMRGGVFSYFEFERREPLSDGAWRRWLDTARIPRSDWTSPFFEPVERPDFPVFYRW